MRCPFCGHPDDRVVDSRGAKEGAAVRRRRECLKCGRRFTTYEQVEEELPLIRKKDRRWEPFDRTKLMNGMLKACQKRPVNRQSLETIANSIEKEVFHRSGREISSNDIGKMVMERLHDLDEVAYVRFASVYRSFKDVSEFMDEVQSLIKRGRRHKGRSSRNA